MKNKCFLNISDFYNGSVEGRTVLVSQNFYLGDEFRVTELHFLDENEKRHAHGAKLIVTRYGSGVYRVLYYQDKDGLFHTAECKFITPETLFLLASKRF